MEDQLTERIYIDEEGEKLLNTNYQLSTVLIGFFILGSLISLVRGAMLLIKYHGKQFIGWKLIFNFQVLPFVMIVQAVLIFFQFYFFIKGIRVQKRALTEFDQALFNKSYYYNRNYLYLVFPVVLINIFAGLIILYLEM